MRIEKSLFAALGAALLAASPALVTAVPAQAQQAQDRDQDRAYDRARNGDMLPLQSLKQRVIPRMRGYEYLDAELRGTTYRFKFVKDGRLVWVDVDGRTGHILRSSNR